MRQCMPVPPPPPIHHHNAHSPRAATGGGRPQPRGPRGPRRRPLGLQLPGRPRDDEDDGGVEPRGGPQRRGAALRPGARPGPPPRRRRRGLRRPGGVFRRRGRGGGSGRRGGLRLPGRGAPRSASVACATCRPRPSVARTPASVCPARRVRACVCVPDRSRAALRATLSPPRPPTPPRPRNDLLTMSVCVYVCVRAVVAL